MIQVSSCYVAKPGSGLVLGVLNPQYGAWVFPGGKVEPGEPMDVAALRELREETGLIGTNPGLLCSARSSLDPQVVVHVFTVDVGSHPLPYTREPGNTVAWVTVFQLCDSQAFGAFYQAFFRRIGRRA